MKRSLSLERYQEIKNHLTLISPEEFYKQTVIAWRESGFEFHQSFESFSKQLHTPLYRYIAPDYPEGMIFEGRKNVWNIAQEVNSILRYHEN